MSGQAPALDDTTLAVLPRSARVAAALSFVAGAFGAVHVAQLFGVLLFIRGPYAALPYLMAVEATAALAAGVGLFRLRGWAPWTAVIASAVLWLTSGFWCVFALAHGFLTLFGFLVPALALAALIATWRARKAADVAARARIRLREQGFELGL